MSIAERSKKLIADHLGVNEGWIRDDAKFADDLGADSLDMVELVMAFEEEFNIEIPDNVAETLLTVRMANEYLAGRVGN